MATIERIDRIDLLISILKEALNEKRAIEKIQVLQEPLNDNTITLYLTPVTAGIISKPVPGTDSGISWRRPTIMYDVRVANIENQSVLSMASMIAADYEKTMQKIEWDSYTQHEHEE